MNARLFTSKKTLLVTLLGATLGMAMPAMAESRLDSTPPIAATLMPTLHVSASIADADGTTHARLAAGQPLRVTLMPTLAITPDAVSATDPDFNAQALAVVESGLKAALPVLCTLGDALQGAWLATN